MKRKEVIFKEESSLSDNPLEYRRNVGGIMKPEKGRSMWDLTAEDEEEEDDLTKLLEEAIQSIFINLVKQEVVNQFVQWFQKSDWNEVRKLLLTSCPPELQLQDEELREVLEVKDGDGDNLLLVALYKAAPTDIVLRLIEIGGKEVIEARNSNGQNSLHYACRYDAEFEVVEKLLDGMDQEFIYCKDEDYMNALHYACSFFAEFDIIKILVEIGGKKLISEVDENGFTALHFACRSGADGNVVKLLLDEGPVDLVLQQTMDNWTALHHACANNAPLRVIKLLLIRDEGLLYMETDDNETAFQLASLNVEDPSILALLIDSLGEENIESEKIVDGLFAVLERGLSAKAIIPFFIGKGIKNILKRNSNNQSLLHVACSVPNAKLDTIQALIEMGGTRLIAAQDGQGDNVMHYCVREGLGADIVKAFIGAGDKDGNLIRRKNSHNCNALHCIRRETPLEVIDCFLLHPLGNELCFEKDRDGDLPLDNMIHRNSKYPKEQILHLQEAMYKEDKTGATLLQSTVENIRDLKSHQRVIALRGKYIRSALNYHTIKPLALYFIMVDVGFQILTLWAFSFEMKRNMKLTLEIKVVVYLCFGWLFLRTALLHGFVINHFFKPHIMQFIVLGLTICSMHFDFSEKANLYLLLFGIGISWLRSLYVLSNIFYRIKVFVSALESITERLLPFLFVAVFITLAFAHIFYAIGPPSEISCPTLSSQDTEIEEYNAGGWTCDLNDSYFQSFAMLLSGDFLFFDKPIGIWSTMTLVFALVIGIVLLNILIAVVNDSFMQVEESSDDIFWLGRLELICKVQIISKWLRLSPEDGDNFGNILKIRFKDKSLKIKPSRHIFSHWDKRDYNDWKYDPQCFSLLHWFEKGEYPSYERSLTWAQRLMAFVKVAEWDEIIPPSKGMIKVVAGIHRRQNIKSWRNMLVSASFCWVIFVVVVAISPIALVVGLFSGGYILPHELKKWIFFGPVEVKKYEESRETTIFQSKFDDRLEAIDRNQQEIRAMLEYLKRK